MSRVAKGKYTAIARESKLGKTDNTGTRFVAVQFELLDPEVDGVLMNWTGWLNDDKAGKDGLTSMDRTLRSLRECGWSAPDL